MVKTSVRGILGKLLGRSLTLGLAALALASLGCGDGGSDLSQFVGTWKYTLSTARFSCPGQADQTGPLATTKHWGGGVKSDLVDLSTTCDYLFDVNSKQATIQKNQTCDFSDVTGTATEAPNSWVFTLLSATTAEEQVETVTTFADSTACTLTAMSTLEKVSKD
jgi:hypothetical protein